MSSETDLLGNSILHADQGRGYARIPSSGSSWFRRRRIPTAKTRLFSFPYAGGGARIFRDWQEWLGPEIEVVAVELPGRGSHLQSPAIDHMPTLTEHLMSALDPLLDLPFALFGHSMGALIAFELSRALTRSGRRTPLHLFVSGMRPPHVRGEGRLHRLSEPEFVEELRKLNGTPAEILENDELREVFLPVVRADLRLAETYQHTSRTPLPVPITVFGGLEDPTAPSHQLHEWAHHTHEGCTVRLLPGDHFFIHQQDQVMAASILESLGSR